MTASPAARLLRAYRTLQQADPGCAKTPWHDLAACMWAPTPDRLAFRGPVRPLGSLLLLVLSHRRRIVNGKMTCHSSFRGYRARLLEDGTTAWDPATLYFAVDLASEHLQGWQVPWNIAGSRVLPYVAHDLFGACVDAARQPWLIARRPVLPTTLLALPPGTAVEPHPTLMVTLHARWRRICWAEAWGELCLKLRRPDLEARFSQRLIDSRLIQPPPHTLQELHLVEPLLGRVLRNPAGGCAGRGRLNPSTLLDKLPKALAAGCSNKDLQSAAAQPSFPLMASGLAAIQVWRPMHHTVPAKAFRFNEPGVSVDLWHPNSMADACPGISSRPAA